MEVWGQQWVALVPSMHFSLISHTVVLLAYTCYTPSCSAWWLVFVICIVSSVSFFFWVSECKIRQVPLILQTYIWKLSFNPTVACFSPTKLIFCPVFLSIRMIFNWYILNIEIIEMQVCNWSSEWVDISWLDCYPDWGYNFPFLLHLFLGFFFLNLDLQLIYSIIYRISIRNMGVMFPCF